MNIFDAKEAKMKSYLKFLHKKGATNRKKSVKIEDVERALRMDDLMFDEITKYLVADGSISRASGSVYITRSGITKL